jgi:beta-lactamase superfamily II metal-dependent hydrolase
MTVSFIDVGHGDAILIELPDGRNMMVDAGTNKSAPKVIKYLNARHVKKIDYLVATHTHKDHIGGMTAVVKAFSVGRVYMPAVGYGGLTFDIGPIHLRIPFGQSPYNDLVRAIRAKHLPIRRAAAGISLIDQPGLKACFVAPCRSRYLNPNDWSAVLRIEYGATSFLLTSDAGDTSEEQMLASGANLRADVLKVGHHGSKDAASKDFLKAVSPRYAVMTVEAKDGSDHPSKKTIKKLHAAGVKIFRTDEDGTITAVSDGRIVTLRTAKGSSTKK